MSNYPPGVTGNEYEIAGPSWTGIMDIECPSCGYEGEADAEGYGMERWAFCECGETVDLPEEEPEE